MIIEIAIGIILLTGLAVVGILLWECRDALQRVIGQQITATEEEAQQMLTRQVDEMHRTLGGMAHSLKAVGHQVYNLNLLAGHALHETSFGRDGGEIDGHDHGDLTEHRVSKIVIEVHQRRGDGDAEDRTITPEDMSPEMREKFRAFKAIYTAAMSEPALPSRFSPEQN